VAALGQGRAEERQAAKPVPRWLPGLPPPPPPPPPARRNAHFLLAFSSSGGASRQNRMMGTMRAPSTKKGTRQLVALAMLPPMM
jgi:hypothetical protein